MNWRELYNLGKPFLWYTSPYHMYLYIPLENKKVIVIATMDYYDIKKGSIVRYKLEDIGWKAEQKYPYSFDLTEEMIAMANPYLKDLEFNKKINSILNEKE